MGWMPIRYRCDFHDVPRFLVVERGGSFYLFDCPFDDALDDYPDFFNVYRLTRPLPIDFHGSPAELRAATNALLGTVSGASLTFDETRRQFLEESVLDGLRRVPPGLPIR